MNYQGVGGLSGRLGLTLVAVVVLAGCSGDSGGAASSATPPSPSPFVAIGTSGPPAPAPAPLPSSAYPPLAGFGEVHDIGTVVGIADDGATVLRLDRKAYVSCLPHQLPQQPEVGECLDGYRIDDVEAGIREYVVAPTVRVTLLVHPEEYETGDLADLREFVATKPSALVILQLDAAGRVIAVGQPFLP